jgi:hypothetical protein
MRANISRLISVLIPLLFCCHPLTAAGGPAEMEAMLAAGVAGEALDRVCGVRDCADIRLFWYTDLEAAKAAAHAEGKPILSLRLLGRLDEEFSCANSRFFRTVFYKNSDINQLLRDRYILHWRSVRPVPKVTIDFGDGSRLERTLTGNSIHYVLDSRGRMLDALPGLYGPAAFQQALEEGLEGERLARPMNDADLDDWLTARRWFQLQDRMEALDRDRKGLPSPTPDRINVSRNDTGSKMIVETPLLRALNPVTDDEIGRFARLRRPSVRLDSASRAFLLSKQGVTDAKVAERLVDSFETSVALDEVINDYRMRPEILTQLRKPEIRESFDLEAFNEWVYEEVFKTPLSDPWLGLAPDDLYTALPASTTRTATRTAAAIAGNQEP